MRLPLVAIIIFLFAFPTFAARYTRPTARTKAAVRPVARKAVRPPLKRTKRTRVWQQTWAAQTFVDEPSLGDEVAGDDPIVRQAAVEALGQYNGTVVVADPSNGRLLTVVNQKLAYRDGFTPCSTIKIVAAMGSLMEGNVDKDSKRANLNLTTAIARSNNAYFAQLGNELGFDRVSRYARMFGLGEKAVYGLDEEHPGTLPQGIPREGLGMMTSFGSGINLTPLQLAAALSSIANGGTLYWLQYPRTQVEVDAMRPRVKRTINVQPVLEDIKPGLAGTVEYGTGRRAFYDASEPVFGKTGTCTHADNQTHLGWFGSFNEVEGRKLVVVVLLTGGRPVNGPVASGVAGEVYKNLSKARYFSRAPLAPFTPTVEMLSRLPGTE
ncbi:MAG: penicillin-binding protein [Bryobacteraceae bacterium]|nr:penicillin-binding protein [Bryobacteraceae bacterium]